MYLALIGYRGSGKTTVAQQVALRLGWQWIDADVEIELRAGKPIAAIFADQGEPAFRELESAVLSELILRNGAVLALGGGVILSESNRQVLAGLGKVVWLTASAATLYERIKVDPVSAAQRPNLSADGGLVEVQRTLAAREPLYRECAHLVVDTEGKTAEAVADEIVRWFGKAPGSSDD